MTTKAQDPGLGLVQLRTERMLLRGLTMDDVDPLVEICSDIEIARTTASIPHPYSRERCEQFLRDQAGDLEKAVGYVWGMELLETGELIGDVGFRVNQEHQRAEAGYIVGKKFWGKGYAPEGLQAVLDFGFRELGLYRIDAHAMPWNEASERVMQKVGMQREGILRGQYLKWGRHEDALVYSTIRPDWEAAQRV